MGGLLGRRQPDEGQVVSTLEQHAGFFELRFALRFDQRRGRIRQAALGIAGGRDALCFDEDRPAGAEATESIVESRGRANQLRRRRGIEVRTSEPCRPLETTVLVQDHTRRDERRPGQDIGEAGSLGAVFGEIQHGDKEPQTERCAG